PRGRVHLPRRRSSLGEERGKWEGGRGKGGGRARAVDGARRAARSGLRPPRWAGPNPVRDVASPGALRTPAPRTRAGTVTLTDAALTLGGALVAGAAALWAGLLALGEEAAVGEALHTLVDAPPATVGARVPLHRALHVARLALLVLGAARRRVEPDLGAAQRDMLLGVFTLADTRVDEVMTPRLDMVAVDLAAPGDDVIEAFRQSEHSRLPVYDGTPDNIAGVVFAKD